MSSFLNVARVAAFPPYQTTNILATSTSDYIVQKSGDSLRSRSIPNLIYPNSVSETEPLPAVIVSTEKFIQNSAQRLKHQYNRSQMQAFSPVNSENNTKLAKSYFSYNGNHILK